MSMDQFTILCLAFTAVSAVFGAILLNRIANDLLTIKQRLELLREAKKEKSSDVASLLTVAEEAPL